jgi:uncharacterized protein (DUF1501 family)
MKRRDFLKSGLSLAALPYILALSTKANATTFSDYKAIVILQLDGGNDAFNTFVPLNSTYSEYKNERKALAIKNSVDLFNNENYKVDNNGFFSATSNNNPYFATPNEFENETFKPENNLEASYKKGTYQIKDSNGNPIYGINSMMPEIAALYNKGVLNIISNVGTLVKPTTKDDYNNNKDLPLFLFAHDHQRRAIATAMPQSIIKTGWLGRVADNIGNINGDIGLNISYDGLAKIMIGKTTNPFTISFLPSTYKSDKIEAIIFNTNQNESDNIFIRYLNKIKNKSVKLSQAFGNSWPKSLSDIGISSKNSYGQTLFSLPNCENDLNLSELHSLDESLFKSFESIVKMLYVSKNSFNFNRQIIYVKYGGFDFHSGQTVDHTKKLRTLSLVLSDFYKALSDLGMQNEVVLATTSDFGRTLLGNGDGTDHGWGGHQIIMGGALNGGKILGDIPDSLDLENSNYLVTHKGRLLPTTSIDSMMAPILDWFGIDENSIKIALPNLMNFATDNNYKSAFLDNLTFS